MVFRKMPAKQLCHRGMKLAEGCTNNNNVSDLLSCITGTV